jgi:hypothetical protein
MLSLGFSENNHKKILPDEYFDNHMPSQTKKTKLNHNSESLAHEYTRNNFCFINSSNFCSSNSDDFYSSDSDINDSSECDMKVCVLTEEFKNLPEIWRVAYYKCWDSVAKLLEFCTSEDFAACPKNGPDKNKTLLILAILNEKWDIVDMIMNNPNYPGEKTFEILKYPKLLKNVLTNRAWDICYECIRLAKSPEIDQTLFDFFIEQALSNQSDNCLDCLFDFICKYRLPIGNDQFNGIISYSINELLNNESNSRIFGCLDEFLSIYSNQGLQFNKENLSDIQNLVQNQCCGTFCYSIKNNIESFIMQ